MTAERGYSALWILRNQPLETQCWILAQFLSTIQNVSCQHLAPVEGLLVGKRKQRRAHGGVGVAKGWLFGRLTARLHALGGVVLVLVGLRFSFSPASSTLAFGSAKGQHHKNIKLQPNLPTHK